MAAMSPVQARVRGGLILILGVPLLVFGVWLMYVALGRPLPDWLPQSLRWTPQLIMDTTATQSDRLRSPAGLGAMFLMGFGGITTLQGLGMLVLGRRSRVLLALMLAFFLVLVGTGLWIALEGR